MLEEGLSSLHHKMSKAARGGREPAQGANTGTDTYTHITSCSESDHNASPENILLTLFKVPKETDHLQVIFNSLS